MSGGIAPLARSTIEPGYQVPLAEIVSAMARSQSGGRHDRRSVSG